MSNIYELTSNYLKLQQMIEAGDFTEEDLADTIEMVTDELEDKAESYGFVITNIQTQVDGLTKEIERLSARKAKTEKSIVALMGSLQKSMIATENEKFTTDHFTFSLRKSSSVLIDDVKLIPKEYKNTTTTTKTAPDKKAIKAAITAGEVVAGASISHNKTIKMV